jgi:RND family efflux transporter MFP subunit
MDQRPLRQLIRSLRDAAGPAEGGADDDAQLLRRFRTCGDQNAFELLLWRHGPMVLGLCRRLLRTEHDAEDAFQATFLTLIKKAGSITSGSALGGWLYRVAYRIALRLRAGLARRGRCEQPGVEEVPAPSAAEPPVDDLRAVLDEEVNRLPARHRAAFVLCCLEGKTGAEAALELGVPAGTVSSRLTRARARLRSRLTRRGLAPSAGLVAALAGEGLAASVPAALVRTTLEAARLFAAGARAGGALSEQAITLTEGVLRAMSLTRLKIATLVLLVVGFLAAGAMFSRPAAEAAPDGQGRQDPPAARAQPPEPEKQDKQKSAAVEVVRPQPGGLKRKATQPCTARAFDRADLVSPVGGYLKVMKVDLGSHVKKGDILAEIDVPLLAVEVKQAELGVRQAQGHLLEKQAAVNSAKAEVTLAKGIVGQREAELERARASLVYQKRQSERMETLAKTGAVDMKLLDEARDKFDAARGQVNAARAAVENAKGEVEVKLGRVTQATAALENARYQVQAAELALDLVRTRQLQTRICAPFDGVVTARHYHAGDYIPAGGRVGQLPLLTIEGMGRMRVVAQISDKDAPFIEPGVPVELTFMALPGLRIPAKVSRVGVAVDEKTHTMRVEIDVPNPKGELRPGMEGGATIQIKNDKPGVLRVPRSAFAPRYVYPGGRFRDGTVYVVRGKTAHRTFVDCSADNENEVEIVSGLRPTDSIVLRPEASWGETVPVTVKKGRGEK